MHDFAIPELGKAVPYGVIHDVSANAGFVNAGISADTEELDGTAPPSGVRSGDLRS